MTSLEELEKQIDALGVEKPVTLSDLAARQAELSVLFGTLRPVARDKSMYRKRLSVVRLFFKVEDGVEKVDRDFVKKLTYYSYVGVLLLVLKQLLTNFAKKKLNAKEKAQYKQALAAAVLVESLQSNQRFSEAYAAMDYHCFVVPPRSQFVIAPDHTVTAQSDLNVQNNIFSKKTAGFIKKAKGKGEIFLELLLDAYFTKDDLAKFKRISDYNCAAYELTYERYKVVEALDNFESIKAERNDLRTKVQGWEHYDRLLCAVERNLTCLPESSEKEKAGIVVTKTRRLFGSVDFSKIKRFIEDLGNIVAQLTGFLSAKGALETKLADLEGRSRGYGDLLPGIAAVKARLAAVEGVSAEALAKLGALNEELDKIAERIREKDELKATCDDALRRIKTDMDTSARHLKPREGRVRAEGTRHLYQLARECDIMDNLTDVFNSPVDDILAHYLPELRTLRDKLYNCSIILGKLDSLYTQAADSRLNASLRSSVLATADNIASSASIHIDSEEQANEAYDCLAQISEIVYELDYNLRMNIGVEDSRVKGVLGTLGTTFLSPKANLQPGTQLIDDLRKARIKPRQMSREEFLKNNLGVVQTVGEARFLSNFSTLYFEIGFNGIKLLVTKREFSMISSPHVHEHAGIWHMVEGIGLSGGVVQRRAGHLSIVLNEEQRQLFKCAVELFGRLKQDADLLTLVGVTL